MSRDVRPPLLGRLLLRVARLGSQRAEVESDLLELLQIRARETGSARARLRYVGDAWSLWTHPRVLHAPSHAPARRGHPMQNFVLDLRYGLRMMRKAPGFTAVAVLSLAVGIGANTTLFSFADAVLFRTLPVPDADRLVLFNWQAPRAFRTPGLRGTFVPGDYAPGWWGSSTFHHRMLTEFTARQRDAASPLESLFAFASLQLTALADGEANLVAGQVVSGHYFSGLRAHAEVGRTITPADDTVTAAPVAVISHRYWRERFGGSASVIGQQISINQISTAIVGVMPASFKGPWQVGQEPAISVPLSLATRLERSSPMSDGPDRPAPYWALVMGRLKPGATREQVRDYFGGAFQQIAIGIMPPPRRPNEPATLEPSQYPQLLALDGSRGLWEMRSVYSPRIALLFGAVGLVLLIACANVANLLLARAAVRGGEITLRLAMGAGRGRVVRQLLTESVMLAGAGGLAGVVLSIWGTRALAAFSRTGGLLPSRLDYSLSWRVVAFGAAASLLTGILFGVVPAWRASRRDLTLALKESSRTGSYGARSWFSRGLVVTQVALSLVLLLGAGLFVRTLDNLQRVDAGFNQEGLLVFGLRPASAGYTGDRLAQLQKDLSARLDALPGVRSSTFAQMPLVAFYMYGGSVVLPGEDAATAPEHPVNRLMVRENYLETMQIPLVRGRGFTVHDSRQAQPVAVINETFARQYFPDRDPIGMRVGFDAETQGRVEIVGVTRDIIYNHQREDKTPLIYVPSQQSSEPLRSLFFTVRADTDPLALVAGVRKAVRDVDPRLPVEDVSTQLALSNETLAEERQYATLIGIAGLMALLLAAIGLYGVIAYWVSQRTREIGLRMALGAQTTRVLRLVVRQAMTLVVIGLVIGAGVSFWLARFVEARLYQVRPSDPVTLTVVAGLLFAMALAACIGPARRAARLDPMIAFRAD